MKTIFPFLVITTLFVLIGRGVLFTLSWIAVKHGGVDVSIVAATYWWSYVVGLPVLGALGDLMQQRAMLVIAALANSAAVILVAVLAHRHAPIDLRLMLPELAVVALMFAIVNPLAGKILYRHTKEEQIRMAFKAKGWLDSIASFSAPAIGGWLIYGVGEANALACYATAGVVLLGAALTQYRSEPQSEVGHRPARAGVASGLADFARGARIVVRVKTELRLAIYMMILNFTITPFLTVVLPVYVGQTMNKSSYALGMIASGFGIGMVIGGLLVLTLHGVSRNINIPISVGGVLLIALGFLGCALFGSTSALAVCLALAGIGVALFNGVITAQRAIAIPDDVRSKFESFMLFSTSLSIPVGTLAVGHAMQMVTVSTLTVGFAVLAVLMVPLLIVGIPRYGDLMRAHEGARPPFYLRSYPAAFNGLSASNLTREET